MKTIGLTFASLGSLGVPAAPQLAGRAEALGYSSFWVAEANGTESFGLLAAAGGAAPGLALGSGVLPIQARSPALAAMGAATLQALWPDRDIILGVGLSAPGVAGRWHGADGFDRPLARMREYLTLVRELLSGEKVTFEGDFWTVRGFRLGVRLGDRRPRVALAALNEGMLRLGGELADVVLLNYLPASHVGWSVERIREGGDAEVHAYVHAAVTDWEAGAGAARKDLFGYAMAPGYARMFAAAGYADEMGAMDEAKAAGDRDAMVGAISDRMVQDIDFIGTTDEVTAFVRTYADAGIDHPILMPMPWGADRRAVTEATMVAAAAALDD
ncbi:MAG: LLM class flavin-dependent oxidoreductase [Actinomycetota bacterium]